MTRAAKQLDAMKRNPREGWTIDDVAGVCRSFGIQTHVPEKGRHLVLSHPWVEGLLTVPATRPIKPLYIQLVVDLAESVQELKQ